MIKVIECGEGCKKAPKATHYVDNPYRYYGPQYERGPWGMIAAILLELHAHPDVDAVYYGGDNFDSFEEFPMAKVLEMCKYFAEWGTRPYDGAFTASGRGSDKRKGHIYETKAARAE